jgi:iron complex outermembrane recepter protein
MVRPISVILTSLTFVLFLDQTSWGQKITQQTSHLNKLEQTTNTTPKLIAQSLTRVTGVKLNKTPKGLQIIFTTAGGEKLQPLILPENKTLIIELLDAVLTLPNQQEFRSVNPAQGIREIIVKPLNATSIQMTVTGTKTVPNAEVVLSQDNNLVLSVTPESIPKTEAETEIDVIATGEAETEAEDYFVPEGNTATRTDTPLRDVPQSIQIVPQQIIEDQGANRLDEVLRNVSGVRPDNSFGGTAQQFNIRGFTQENILIDGFRQGSFGQEFPSPEQLERVEVLKGPASVLYGNLEPGGIINLVLKQPLQEPLAATNIELGSFGLVSTNFDFSGPINSQKTILYRLNTYFEAEDGFRDYEQSTSRINLSPTISWQISKNTDLQIDFSYLSDERPFDRGIAAIGTGIADIPYDRVLQDPQNEADLEQINVGYRLEHSFNDNWQLRNSFNFVSSDISYFRLDTIGIEDSGILERDYRLNEEQRENYSLQTNAVGKFATGSIKHQLLFGVDLNRAIASTTQQRLPDEPIFPINIFTLEEAEPLVTPERSEFTLFANDDQAQADLIGIYLQDQVEFSKQFKVLLGGRLDVFKSEYEEIVEGFATEQSGERLSPRVGVVYQPIESLSLFASYSQSYNPDLFSVTVEGTSVEPSVGTQYEVGIKGEFLEKKLSTTLAAYQINKTNVATTDPDNTDFQIALGEVRSRGIELDVAGKILPGWNIIASYAYTNAEITEDTEIPVGTRFVNVPENSVSLWTSYEIQQGSLQGLGLGVGVFFVDDRPGDSDNTFELPSYVRTDAALYYRQKGWEVGLNFQNLFDVDYVQSSFFRESVEPGDPFTVIGSVSIEL